MATTGRDYYEVLGVPRTAPEADIKRVPAAGARAAPGRLGRAGRGHAVQGSRRGVRGALEVGDARALRPLRPCRLRSGGFRPTPFDLGSLADIFSAFFGDDAFGVATGARRARGSGHRCRDRDLARGSRDGDHAAVPVQVAIPRGVRGDGVQPGTSVSTCQDCGGTGRIQHISGRPSASSSAARLARCKGTGRFVEHPWNVQRRRARPRGAKPRRRGAGRHHGQRIRLSGEGHAGPLGGKSGDLYVLVRIRPHERLVREGDNVYSTVDLTMTEAALGTRANVPTSTASWSSSSQPERPGECARVGAACRCCRASAAVTTECSSTSPSRASSRRSSGGCSPSSSERRTTRRTDPTRASSRS